MILTNSGVLKLMQRIKSFITSQLNTKAASVHTHSISEIDNLASQLGDGYSKSEVDTLLNGKADTGHTHTKSQITDFPSYGTTANTICEGNDSRLSDARTPTSHTHTKSEITDFPSLATVATSGSYADLSNKPTIPVIDSALSSTSENGLQNKAIKSALDGKANSTHTHSASDITSGTLNTDRIPNLDASKITSGTIDIARLPAGALERLVTVTNETARFNLTANDVQLGDVVKQLDTGVMYYVVDTANLNSEDGFSEFTAGSATSVPWSGVTGKPSSYTPSSHTHGNITDAGAIGSTANKPLITTTNGVITTGSFGTTANTFCQGNDSRLSDARTPTAHTHSASDITSGLATVATSGSYNDLSNKPTIPSKTSDLTNDSGFITSDNTKIPLSGTNALAGSIVPSTDISYYLGSANYRFREGHFGNLWTGGLFGNLDSGIDINYLTGANLILRGKNRPSEAGIFWLVADNGSNSSRMMGSPDGTLTWGSKNIAMQEDVIPRSGGAVMTEAFLGRNNNAGELCLGGGTDTSATNLSLFGKDAYSELGLNGVLRMIIRNANLGQIKIMLLYPSGTWTWEGTAVQLVSDQRLKQQIADIDDKLLDAWEDVDLVQFKYNDAVDQKKDKARLHTGYVVQQIDSACKEHGVDVSQYGLYCHEEYPEETEEVEVEQADGTKTKERKVIREASEHYSLRYTEVYAIECAYLRRENARLKQQMQQYTESLSKLEERLKALEQTSK